MFKTSISRLFFIAMISLAGSTAYGSVSSFQDIAPEFVSQNDEISTIKLEARYLNETKRLTKELSQMLILIMNELANALDYWQAKKLSPLSLFVVRGPMNWFSGQSQNTDVTQKITFLQKEYERIAYYLGKLNYNRHELEALLNTPEFFAKLAEQQILIHDCIHFDNARASISQNSWEELIEVHRDNQTQTSAFYANCQRRLEPCKIPGHFSRNWLGYTATAAALIAGYTYYSKNTDICDKHARLITDKLTNFGHNALHYAKSAFNSVFSRPETTIIDGTGVQTSENNLKASITSVLKKAEFTDQEIDQEWSYYQQHGTFDRLNTLRIQEEGKPLISMVKSALQDSPPYIEKMRENIIHKIEDRRLVHWALADKETVNGVFDPIMELVDKQTDPNVKGLLASFLIVDKNETKHTLAKTSYLINTISRQVLTLLGAGSMVVGGVLAYTCGSRLMRTSYGDIQRVIHIIHRTVNTSISNNERQKHIDHGITLYWIEKLKKLANAIAFDHRVAFLADLQILSSFTASREQKLIMIEQMYRRYPFLSK